MTTATDFINIATAIAKRDALSKRIVQNSLDIKDEEADALRERIAELEAVLNLFVKQWNACGPNSDFGRYFSNVRDAAKAALEVRS